ncbi:glycosyltransferase [Stenotrophomonas sp. C3(2023)]|uniref:glycosyltransferase n=1 Tax=Stenotrophomonas sp. C3(2023) TaxID=3080277 RepID=UPI00293CAACA|nr:glycosyltransferase [Stenotrophomonas sp. C3(2023)]MDV3469689.1 glycosyltransferase [Stenotrophomonas sp. C3(2023)]
MSNNLVRRIANSAFVKRIERTRAARRLVRTAFVRKLADLMRKVANRVEMANGQSPAPEASSWTVPSMPAWVEEEMRAIAHLEPELIPAGGDLSKYGFYSVPADPAPGEAYYKLLEQVGDGSFSHVLLVPWLKQGGADRGIIYHARAIIEATPSANILVVATEPTPSPWADRLPDGTRFVDFGLLAGHLHFDRQVAILVRLMVQLQPPVIHLINSRVGWEMVRQYAKPVRQYSTLFASLFCDDYDANMVPVGYARDYLRDCYQEFSTIFCDNSQYPRIWSHDLGVPLDTFTVLPFPYDGDIDSVPAKAISRLDARRILWAGRLDRQKRPDILARIAVRMPDVEFDVYGTAVISGQGESSAKVLHDLPNVTLHGEFRRLEEVVTPEHFAYLHTTAWEGTPTILFDVAAAGLPICAPAVGGIVDFLGEDDLIASPEDVDAFVSTLEALRASVAARDGLVLRQRQMLDTQRRWGNFLANLDNARAQNSAPR